MNPTNKRSDLWVGTESPSQKLAVHGVERMRVGHDSVKWFNDKGEVTMEMNSSGTHVYYRDRGQSGFVNTSGTSIQIERDDEHCIPVYQHEDKIPLTDVECWKRIGESGGMDEYGNEALELIRWVERQHGIRKEDE